MRFSSRLWPTTSSPATCARCCRDRPTRSPSFLAGANVHPSPPNPEMVKARSSALVGLVGLVGPWNTYRPRHATGLQTLPDPSLSDSSVTCTNPTIPTNPQGVPVQEHELVVERQPVTRPVGDRKSTRLNSSHLGISYAV